MGGYQKQVVVVVMAILLAFLLLDNLLSPSSPSSNMNYISNSYIFGLSSSSNDGDQPYRTEDVEPMCNKIMNKYDIRGDKFYRPQIKDYDDARAWIMLRYVR